MGIYTSFTHCGNIGLFVADNLEQANKKARQQAKEFDLEIKHVRKATRDDIEWVHLMGGYIPDELMEKRARKRRKS